MFVKMPYANSDEMIVSDAPVCQGDLISTIKYIAGIDCEDRIITEFTEDEDRTRITRLRWGDVYVKYQVSGNVRELNNWNTLFSNWDE
jgi:hypothetical protein